MYKKCANWLCDNHKEQGVSHYGRECGKYTDISVCEARKRYNRIFSFKEKSVPYHNLGKAHRHYNKFLKERDKYHGRGK